MSKQPTVASMTTAPLRNRLRVELNASVADVWKLLGDLSRFPEYSAGLERVENVLDSKGRLTAYVCHFRPFAKGEPGIVHRENIRWYEAQHGFASSAEANNAFGLTNDVNLTTLEASPGGTIVSWDVFFDATDVPAGQASYDQAFADMGERLTARFGGCVIERFARAPENGGGPAAAVAAFTDAMHRADLKAAAACYADDAVLLAQPNARAQGSAEIVAALQGFVALRPTLTTSASTVVETRDDALYIGRWRLNGIAPDGAVVTMEGESTDVLKRDAKGRWRIALDNPWGTALLPRS